MSRLENEILNYESKYTINGVLKNKLGILDEEELNRVERMITSKKLIELYLNPGIQTFDVNHYLRIHKFLFEDIYDFAGDIRDENISKSNPFCLPQFIFHALDDTLKKARLKSENIKSRDELLSFITKLYSDLNIIHPFREGNGRCEREFLRQFINHICKMNNLEHFELRYDLIENRDQFVKAVIKADCYLDFSDLFSLFDSILMAKDQEKQKKYR